AGQGLYAMRADGTTAAVELISAATRVTDARFSLDGAHVLYRVIDTSTSPATSRVTLADVLADSRRNVPALSHAPAAYPTTGFLQGMDLSLGRSRIVLSIDGDLFTVALAGGGAVRLTNTTAAEKYPRWSPVDDRVACTRYADPGIAVADAITIDSVTGATRTV